jgi:hypothetical protein
MASVEEKGAPMVAEEGRGCSRDDVEVTKATQNKKMSAPAFTRTLFAIFQYQRRAKRYYISGTRRF